MGMGDPSGSGRHRPLLRLLLTFGLIAAGMATWLLLAPRDGGGPRLLRPDQPIDADAREPLDISANNSPTAARNPVHPENVVVANRVDRPRYSCAVHVSVDGARSWHEVTVPFPPGEEEPARCYAPDAAYSPDGTLYLSYVTLKGVGNAPNAVWVVSSSDGGLSLSQPMRAAGPLAFQVQLMSDATEPDRLHLTWLQASAVGFLLFPSTGNPIVASTSEDRGVTWRAPVRITSEGRERPVAPSPAAGPRGELYVAYLDLLDDRLDYGGAHEGRGGPPHAGPWALVLARSADGGATWEESVVAEDLVPTQRFIVFLPPFPALAVDADSGRLYITFSDGRYGDADVWLWASGDGGRSFESPVRVNDTSERDGTSQYLPGVGVAPGGRVDIVYLDRRTDLSDVLTEVSLQSSFDGGRTFTTRLPLSERPFSSRIGPGGDRDLPDLGSRLGLVSTEEGALAVWPDTTAGTELTQKQFLASAIVQVPAPAGSSVWLRRVGLVVIVSTVVGLGLATARSGRPPGPAR